MFNRQRPIFLTFINQRCDVKFTRSESCTRSVVIIPLDNSSMRQLLILREELALSLIRSHYPSDWDCGGDTTPPTHWVQELLRASHSLYTLKPWVLRLGETAASSHRSEVGSVIVLKLQNDGTMESRAGSATALRWVELQQVMHKRNGHDLHQE